MPSGNETKMLLDIATPLLLEASSSKVTTGSTSWEVKDANEMKFCDGDVQWGRGDFVVCDGTPRIIWKIKQSWNG